MGGSYGNMKVIINFFCSLSGSGWNCYSVLLQCCQVKA